MLKGEAVKEEFLIPFEMKVWGTGDMITTKYFSDETREHVITHMVAFIDFAGLVHYYN